MSRSLWGSGVAMVAVGIGLVGCGSGSSGDTTTYTVPSPAMEPTFSPGDEVSVDLHAYEKGGPVIGDAIVLHPPKVAKCAVRRAPKAACPRPTAQSSSQIFLKRVVALPGDQLSIRHGQPIVNGDPVLTEVIQTCNEPWCDLPHAITVIPGHFFVMGDNSEGSEDSRFWGPVERRAIIGKVRE